MNDLPWLFHFPDPELAAELAPVLYGAGAVVIADPAHLPEDMRKFYVHTVTVDPADPDNLAVLIHGCDWSFPAGYAAGEPEFSGLNVYAVANNLTEMFPEPEDLPEGTPQHVIEWISYDE